MRCRGYLIRILVPVLLTLLSIVVVGPAGAYSTLWYNGDLDYTSYLHNGRVEDIFYTWDYDIRTFDDFTVSGTGWNVNSVWSHNLYTVSDPTMPAVTQAYWEIRSGVSAGNGGALIASGQSAATMTDTGIGMLGFEQYRVQVDGLNVALAPGTYWLAVAPAYSDPSWFDWMYVPTTSGANSVGSPAGNNGNAFFYFDYSDVNGTYPGQYYDPVEFNVGYDADFSMGVAGSPLSEVPEPGSIALLGLGIAGLVRVRNKRSRS